ncbi:MAG TPA: hypothetical protein VGP88_06970 [Thermoplasmata archaeon]|nr:hypothetical protein [Thermoplasmata archaeon]
MSGKNGGYQPGPFEDMRSPAISRAGENRSGVPTTMGWFQARPIAQLAHQVWP